MQSKSLLIQAYRTIKRVLDNELFIVQILLQFMQCKVVLLHDISNFGDQYEYYNSSIWKILVFVTQYTSIHFGRFDETFIA